jgi:anti-sigma28 factor (negative regulator of flagellin synthesis)
MDVIRKSCLSTELSLLIDSKAAGEKRTQVIATVDSAKVIVSKEAGQSQRVANRLGRKSDHRFAERIRELKEIIAKGDYRVDPRVIARSIIRTEISRQLERSKIRSIHVDLTELLALAEEEIAGQCGGVKDARCIEGPRRTSPTNRSSTKSSLRDCLR